MEVAVNINLAFPGVTPVTIPPLVIVATNGLVLVQVPPAVGVNVVIDPTQIGLFPVITATGLAFTTTGAVGSETQPVEDWVYTKVALPGLIPMTRPALLTVAMVGFKLDQLPLTVGDNEVLAPSQIVEGPIIVAAGLLFTVMVVEATDVHPVELSVNTKVAVPGATPVTMPLWLMVAILGLLLTQLPPLDGSKAVEVPTQIFAGPFNEIEGLPFTVTCKLVPEAQPFAAVKVSIDNPLDTPVITPALVIVATAVLLLVQEPPVAGNTFVVVPAQMVDGPLNCTGTPGLTVTIPVASDTHPVLVSVK